MYILSWFEYGIWMYLTHLTNVFQHVFVEWNHRRINELFVFIQTYLNHAFQQTLFALQVGGGLSTINSWF